MNLVLQLCGWVLLGGEAHAAAEEPAFWHNKAVPALNTHMVDWATVPPAWTLPPETLMPAKVKISSKKNKRLASKGRGKSSPDDREK